MFDIPSGEIDAKELRAALKMFGFKLSKVEIASVMSAIDED